MKNIETRKELLQELYDAINVGTIDLLEHSGEGIRTTSQLRATRCAKLASDWIKTIKEKEPDFKLFNRLTGKINEK